MKYYYITEGIPVDYEHEVDLKLFPTHIPITEEEYNNLKTNKPKEKTDLDIRNDLYNNIQNSLINTDKTQVPDRINDLDNVSEFMEYRLLLRKILFNWDVLTTDEIKELIPIQPIEKRKSLGALK